MRVEVHSAADFLMNLLRVKHGKDLSDLQLEKFKGSIADLMLNRYQSHWYPDLPTRGSGYRCIRINGKMDPIIEQAGVAVGLHPRILRKMLPQELTMWVDPDEVAYRIGENGSICVLFDAVQSRASPSSDLDSTGSGEEFIMERVGRIDISVLDYLVDSSPNSKLNHQSPPQSPPYYYNNHNSNNNHRYKSQHQPRHNSNNHHHHHHQNNHYNNNNHHNNNHQQQQHHHQQQQQQQNNQHNSADNSMYHWESGFHNFNNFNNKVRTQC